MDDDMEEVGDEHADELSGHEGGEWDIDGWLVGADGSDEVVVATVVVRCGCQEEVVPPDHMEPHPDIDHDPVLKGEWAVVDPDPHDGHESPF